MAVHSLSVDDLRERKFAADKQQAEVDYQKSHPSSSTGAPTDASSSSSQQ